MSGRYVVRYRLTRQLGEFAAKGGQEFPRLADVVVRGDRGVELGVVLCPATERTHELLKNETEGTILRLATFEDLAKRDELIRREQEEFRVGLEQVQQRRLPMQLIDVEHLFGEDRVIFYYVAEQRVDFRELVKSLARLLNVRIEMRQLGVRDEAKLLADYGDCGKPVCCNTHLREMPPVSMKMAKLQKATLDPNKISGRCGRLKCCLRYEYETYETYRRDLPAVGSVVVTKKGQGKVIGLEILAQKLMVLYEDNRQLMTDADEVLTVVSRKKGGSG